MKMLTNNTYSISNNELKVEFNRVIDFPRKEEDFAQLNYNELICAIKFTGCKNIRKANKYEVDMFHKGVTKTCEFCLKTIKFYKSLSIIGHCGIIICDKCIKNPVQLNYILINKSDNVVHNKLYIDKVQSTKNKLYYTYSITHDIHTMTFDNLINGLWKNNKNTCYCCKNNASTIFGSCIACYNISFTRYYNDHWSKIITFACPDLCQDVNNVIIQYSFATLDIHNIDNYKAKNIHKNKTYDPHTIPLF